MRPSTDVTAIHDSLVAGAANYIRAHLHEGIAVEDVVRELRTTRSLLEKRFRKALGRSPQVHIRHLQVSRVKDLLRETEYPLKAVAELAGFAHPEYLSVVFKRLVGESPGRFRQRFRPAEEGDPASASFDARL